MFPVLFRLYNNCSPEHQLKGELCSLQYLFPALKSSSVISYTTNSIPYISVSLRLCRFRLYNLNHRQSNLMVCFLTSFGIKIKHGSSGDNDIMPYNQSIPVVSDWNVTAMPILVVMLCIIFISSIWFFPLS